jgi:peroxiredoxin Q/BCP
MDWIVAHVVRGGMIEVGKKAPSFALASSDGGTVSLADHAGKRVVLYFYPRDNTPGCTVEAQDFRDALPAFAKLDTVVLGVSGDSIASHCKFRDKYALTFPLLSDPDTKMMSSYGAYGDKVMYGKKMKGVIRSTVLIDTDGTVAKHWAKVSVKGHAAAVLDAISALDGGAPAGAAAPAPATNAKKAAPKAKKPAAKAAKPAAKAKKPAAKAKKPAAKKKR